MPRVPPLASRSTAGRAFAAAPALVFLVASFSADLVAVAGRDPIGIWAILPAGPVSGSWLNAEVSSTALLLVSIALFRRKRVGWWLAMALLTAAVVVQGALHHHPIAVVAAVAVGAILIATRNRFVVRTGTGEIGLAALLLGFGAAAVGLDAITSGSVLSRHAERLFGTWLDAGSIGHLSLASGLAVLVVIARVAFIGAIAVALDPAQDPRSVAERQRSRTVLRRVGRGALLPYQLGPQAESFAEGTGRSALAYARAGRTAIVLGDPASEWDADASDPGDASGPGGANHVPGALDEFVELCGLLDWTPAVYQASADLRERLVERGWHAIRIGAEAVVDPRAFDISTPRLANVRHTVTRARKGGLAVWLSDDGASGLPPAASPDRLADLDSEWQRGRGPRLGFTVGQFHPATLGGCTVAAATDSAGELAAFVVLRPTGADRGWMLDVMRRRRAAVPGAIELCLVTTIVALRERGIERLSLGLAPLAGLRPSAGPLEERLLAVGARALGRLYDVDGLAFFKDKLGPTWEPRYLAVPSRTTTLGAGFALLRLHLGGSWPAVIRSVASPVLPRLHPQPVRHDAHPRAR